MTAYIHYGSDRFHPDLFIPVRNGDWLPKPAAGTGLWASRVDDEFGWEAWCREGCFNLDSLRQSFRFRLLGASVLTLEDPDQLTSLPKRHTWEPEKPPEIAMPAHGQSGEWYVPAWCYLDFEKLAEVYDAIELRNSGAFKDALPAWDCDCILVLRADKVREV